MAATPGLPVSSPDYHRVVINPTDTTQFCFSRQRLHLAYLSLHLTTIEWSSIQQTPHSSASAGSGYTWLTCLLAGPSWTPHSSASAGSGYTWLTCLLAGPPWAPHSLAPSWPPGQAAARCQRPTPSGSPTSYPAATPAGCLQHTAGQAVKSRRQPMPWFTLYIQQRR